MSRDAVDQIRRMPAPPRSAEAGLRSAPEIEPPSPTYDPTLGAPPPDTRARGAWHGDTHGDAALDPAALEDPPAALDPDHAPAARAAFGGAFVPAEHDRREPAGEQHEPHPKAPPLGEPDRVIHREDEPA